MKRILSIIFCIFLSPVFHKATAQEQWESSQLSDETMELALAITRQYHGCLNQEVTRIPLSGKDSRAVTDMVLKKCEPKLTPIREAFTKEKVTPSIINRYLRRKRTQAARQLLRQVILAQSHQIDRTESPDTKGPCKN